MIEIVVTPDDVNAALNARHSHRQYNNETMCPFAQSFLRTGAYRVRIHPDFITVYLTPHAEVLDMGKRYEATPTMRRAMSTFDRRGRFTPHTFRTRER
jgi:hypothetical protein